MADCVGIPQQFALPKAFQLNASGLPTPSSSPNSSPYPKPFKQSRCSGLFGFFHSRQLKGLPLLRNVIPQQFALPKAFQLSRCSGQLAFFILVSLRDCHCFAMSSHNNSSYPKPFNYPDARDSWLF
ncbi:MAG: hypothetical protein RL372_1848 [Bacteroidota bacterium]|jgi:hypothetical protein